MDDKRAPAAPEASGLHPGSGESAARRALVAALGGRYALDDGAMRGGMATVYRARDVRHDRAVAIKVMRPDTAGALGDRRFRDEIGIAAQLQHPLIVPLHESGEVEGLPYYVMPFVEGESLRARLARAPAGAGRGGRGGA
jgi:eukaryotic-like serine/threonine-protein kinase